MEIAEQGHIQRPSLDGSYLASSDCVLTSPDNDGTDSHDSRRKTHDQTCNRSICSTTTTTTTTNNRMKNSSTNNYNTGIIKVSRRCSNFDHSCLFIFVALLFVIIVTQVGCQVAGAGSGGLLHSGGDDSSVYASHSSSSNVIPGQPNIEAPHARIATAPTDKLEETVFTEMLRIVDQKFDSLSARIGVLERSVNSLNAYSVRQFRLMAESLETVTESTEVIRSQVNKVDVDGRALKQAVSQTGRDISGMRTDLAVTRAGVGDLHIEFVTLRSDVTAFKGDSGKLLDDIANSIVYLNQNMEHKTEGLRQTLEEVQKFQERLEGQLSDQQDTETVMLKHLEDLAVGTLVPNCKVDFIPLQERIDLRFAEMKRESHFHFVDLINARDSSEEEESKNGGLAKEVDEEAIDQGPLNIRSRSGNHGLPSDEGHSTSDGDGEQVMTLLANMTSNVMEAVAYFRHTGGLLERLVASSEAVQQEQTRLRYDTLEANGRLSPTSTEERGEDILNNIAEGGYENEDGETGTDNSKEEESTNQLEMAVLDKVGSSRDPKARMAYATGRQTVIGADGLPRLAKLSAAPPVVGNLRGGGPSQPSMGSGGAAGGASMHRMAEESLRVLGELTRNGTQLLEVLTDLAQLSSTSLTQAVGSLHQEVVRLEDVRARFNEALQLPTKDATSSPSSSLSSVLGLTSTNGELRSLQNTTKTIFTIVEAIASNTGWIPYIFHNMQHVERLTNRTLELAKRSLLTMHWNKPGASGTEGEEAAQERRDSRKSVTKADALDVIYDTNVKLQRIMPALTRLLAEPDALVALSDGRRSNEGRVEVFHKGQWGSVCRWDMSHEEASVICRHLGYVGGIWAGDNFFERGSGGRLWQLNITCLSSHLCPFVSNSSATFAEDECPGGHFGVICDHMLRMERVHAGSAVTTAHNEAVGSTAIGLVFMYHQGHWMSVCAHGWSGYEARVACKQMGFRDGRELELDNHHAYTSRNSSDLDKGQWVAGVNCHGDEVRLDACKIKTYGAKECPYNPNSPHNMGRHAGVRCQ